MGSTLLAAVVAAPLNSALIAFCSLLWLAMWNWRVGLDDVSVSYSKVVRERQVYRIVSAQMVHSGFMHVMFNMASLTSLNELEMLMGTAAYLRVVVALLLLCMVVFLGATHIAVTRFGREDWAASPAVGFSAVIFGLMTLVMSYVPSRSVPILFGLTVPAWIAPWAFLAITQLLIPRASFLGHAAGILAGYAIMAGCLTLLSTAHFWMIAANVAVICLLSLKANPATSARLPCVAVSPAFVAAAAPASGAANGAAAPRTRAYMDGGRLHAAQDAVTVDTGVAPHPPAQTTGAASLAAAWSRTRATAASLVSSWRGGRVPAGEGVPSAVDGEAGDAGAGARPPAAAASTGRGSSTAGAPPAPPPPAPATV